LAVAGCVAGLGTVGTKLSSPPLYVATVRATPAQTQGIVDCLQDTSPPSASTRRAADADPSPPPVVAVWSPARDGRPGAQRWLSTQRGGHHHSW
jgi:hypothetical protein